MVNRRTAIESLVLLVVLLIVLLGFAVLSGLRKSWPRMMVLFVNAFVLVGACFFTVIGHIIDAQFDHLAHVISHRTHPEKPVMTEESNRKTFRRSNKARALEIVSGTIGVVSAPIYLCLGILSGLRQAWLMFCVYLLSCAITTAICVAVLISVKIVVRSRNIEELVSS